jgi:hypothetical protein
MATTTCGNANPTSLVVTATAPVQISSGSGTSTPLKVIEFTTKKASCFGFKDGSVTISVEGGVSPYTFEFNGKIIKNSNTINDLAAGNYSVNVVDFNGVSSKVDFTIDEPEKLEAKAFVISYPSYNFLNDGHAVISATGGIGTYSYSWSNSDKTQEVKNLSPGTYTATVIDENHCSNSVEVVMTAKEIKSGEAEDIVDLNIYPIPAVNELNIEFKNTRDINYLLRIISIDGKVFFNEIIMPEFDSVTSLNTTVWPSAPYFVLLIDQYGNTVLVKKIMIQH